MGRNKQKKQAKWREEHGIAGELQLNVNQLFILEALLRKMVYPHYRDPLMLNFYLGITGTYVGTTDKDWTDLAHQFDELMKRTRTAERLRLGLDTPLKAEDEEPEYCC